MQREIVSERTSRVITTWYYLIGEAGGVSYMFMHSIVPNLERTYPLDLSVHARAPIYADQPCHDKCEVIGGKCYHSGSTRLADELYKRFMIHNDHERLWLDLERHYGTVFGF